MSTNVTASTSPATGKVTFEILPDLKDPKVRAQILDKAGRAARHSRTQRLRALKRRASSRK